MVLLLTGFLVPRPAFLPLAINAGYFLAGLLLFPDFDWE
jgi:hypothetical protein